MKISKETISILKNFSNINGCIELKKGCKLRTAHPQKTILAEAEIEEELPQDFAIYDLNQFLSIEDILDSPDFDFLGNFVRIKDSSNRVINYLAADRDTLQGLPPQKIIDIPKFDITIDLNQNDLQTLRKSAAVLDLNAISIKGSGEGVKLLSFCTSKKDGNVFELDTNVESSATFEYIIRSDNLKILDGNYRVSLSERASFFENKDRNLTYWIAVEQDSTLK